MNPVPRAPLPEPESGPSVVHCHVCRRTLSVAADEVEGYTLHGWPRCCGEVMSVGVKGEPPAPPLRPDPN